MQLLLEESHFLIEENMTNKRPAYVTLIAWYLIIGSALSMMAVFFARNNSLVVELMKQNPLSVSLQFIISIVIGMINLINGIYILKGRNWARYLFIGVSIIGITVSLITSPLRMTMLPGILILLAVTFALFYPVKSRLFFKRQ